MEVSAGGIVYRRGARGPEILVIEDRFGRIAYPKGHLEAGETPEQAALREVEEETGIRGTIEGYLGRVSYRYVLPGGSPQEKVVDVYLIRALEGELSPQYEEIVDAYWVSPAQALELQETRGYVNNAEVFREAVRRLARESRGVSRGGRG
ncbi:MAG: NUDIX domain-containing protein [Brockia lithotrophica]|nr:NUDIX domain-containing protein [Brockia lithotrophica]